MNADERFWKNWQLIGLLSVFPEIAVFATTGHPIWLAGIPVSIGLFGYAEFKCMRARRQKSSDHPPRPSE